MLLYALDASTHSCRYCLLVWGLWCVTICFCAISTNGNSAFPVCQGQGVNMYQNIGLAETNTRFWVAVGGTIEPNHPSWSSSCEHLRWFWPACLMWWVLEQFSESNFAINRTMAELEEEERTTNIEVSVLAVTSSPTELLSRWGSQNHFNGPELSKTTIQW